MDISFITEYISPISLMICLVVGFIIKTCTTNEVLHRFIPCIAAGLGVIICCWDAMAFTPAVIAAGLISGLASTGLYEALSNIFHLVEGEKKENVPEINIEGTD